MSDKDRQKKDGERIDKKKETMREAESDSQRKDELSGREGGEKKRDSSGGPS